MRRLGQARLTRAILAAHRTGWGEWFAVVTSLRREHGREGLIEVADAKAKTRDEAIEVSARLMAEKALRLSPDGWLSVAIVSALE